MGLYDQLLSNTQQGLTMGDQLAMQRANRPGLADVFMDRFRQGGQDRLAEQKTLHDMALNDVYKQSQMQQMRDTTAMHNRQRDLELSNHVSKNLSGQDAYESMAAFVKSQGGDPSIIPQMKFKPETYTNAVESQPVFPEASMAEGGEDTNSYENVTTQTPVRYSDMGAQYGMQQKALDQKKELAELSLNQKMLMDQAKRDRPQDPLGKLTESFRKGLIPAEDYYAMKDKMFFIADPTAGPIANSGYRPESVQLNSRGTTLQRPGQLPQQVTQAGNMGPQQEGIVGQPSATQTVAQRPIVAPAAQQRKTPTQLPERQPLPKKIEEMENEKSAYQAADSKLESLEKTVDSIINNPAYASSLSPAGLLLSRVPKTAEYGVHQNIEVLRNKIMLEAMDALKNASKTGATGMGALSEKEGETLRNSIASLNTSMRKEDFDASIKTIKSEISRLRGLAALRLNNMGNVRGLGEQAAPKTNVEGEVSPTGAFVFMGGSWVKRGN